ncbi:MAG TPA: ankyrin repeat domain-containing protein [Bacteroidales bacterium]|nr:ankyrin repeat domain-containing protein [Bacteroidales bacterium]
MKNRTLLSIAVIISLTTTQCMPMAATRSFLSRHIPTYKQVATAIKSTPTALAKITNKHKAITTLALLYAAVRIPQTRRAISQGIQSCIHGFHSSREIIRQGNLLNTLLLTAAKKGYSNIVKGLIKLGAQTNTRDQSHMTALHWAANNGHSNVIRVITQRGAYHSPIDSFGSSPLHYAVLHNNIAAIHALITAGTNLNIQNIGLNTPLHDAAYHNNVAAIHALITAHANPNIVNFYGHTPLYYAQQHDNLGAIQAISDASIA